MVDPNSKNDRKLQELMKVSVAYVDNRLHLWLLQMQDYLHHTESNLLLLEHNVMSFCSRGFLLALTVCKKQGKYEKEDNLDYNRAKSWTWSFSLLCLALFQTFLGNIVAGVVKELTKANVS